MNAKSPLGLFSLGTPAAPQPSSAAGAARLGLASLGNPPAPQPWSAASVARLGLFSTQPAQHGTGLINSARAISVQPGLLGLASAAPQSPLKWMYVEQRFQAFQQNLALTERQVLDGATKATGVISCLNAAYWGNSSQTDNAFFIGSWAKNTRTRPPRDVDLYFVLPRAVYERFQAYAPGTNRQSALLQEVKFKLLASYPRSAIKGDGPVVLAAFDSYNVEIVPAFLYSADERSYYVCDTNNGGSYKKTMPVHEFEAIDAADRRNNGNVRHLVRMLKCWQAWCSVPIKSFCLELLAIEFLDQWRHRDQSFFYHDWMCRDFFEWLLTAKVDTYVFAPGSYEALWLGDAWKTRAESALSRARKACDAERDNDELGAGDEWQKIFGLEIPRYA